MKCCVSKNLEYFTGIKVYLFKREEVAAWRLEFKNISKSIIIY